MMMMMMMHSVVNAARRSPPSVGQTEKLAARSLEPPCSFVIQKNKNLEYNVT